MVGVELVARPRDPRAVPAAARLTEAVVRIARERGLLLYSGTGNANGVDGDTILLGPPFVITDDELVRIADGLAEAWTSRSRAWRPAPAPSLGLRHGAVVASRCARRITGGAIWCRDRHSVALPGRSAAAYVAAHQPG